MVVVMVVAGFQELRLDVEDAVEVERVAVEHGGERQRAAFGAVQARVGVDAADAGLDLAQVGITDEVGLVDQDHVGEGDLVLRFGRVLG